MYSTHTHTNTGSYTYFTDFYDVILSLGEKYTHIHILPVYVWPHL